MGRGCRPPDRVLSVLLTYSPPPMTVTRPPLANRPGAMLVWASTLHFHTESLVTFTRRDEDRRISQRRLRRAMLPSLPTTSEVSTGPLREPSRLFHCLSVSSLPVELK